jgi:hypothetical protein
LAVLIRNLRECSAREYDKRPNELKLVNAIFFKALELLSKKDEFNATRLLSFFRDHYFLSDKGSVVEGLAQGFLRYGYESIAALLFVDAYMCSRGGGGWLSLGDEQHFYLLDKAHVLSRRIALREFFDRVKDVLSHPGYIMGLTRYLILLCEKFDNSQTTLKCWYEALRVIQTRLISFETVPCLFEGQIEAGSDWSLDELFIGLLFSIEEVPNDAHEFIVRTLPTKAIRPLRRVYPEADNAIKLRILRALGVTAPFARSVAECIKEHLEISVKSGWPLADPSREILNLLAI